MADKFGLSDPFDTRPLYQAPMQQAFGAFPGGAPAAPAPAAPKPVAAAAPKAPVAAAAPTAPGSLTDAQMEEQVKRRGMQDYLSGPTSEDRLSALREEQEKSQAAESEYMTGLQSRFDQLQQKQQEMQVMRQHSPQLSDFAKETSPLAMIAMAIGGKAFGLTGQMMMGAMTGMVQGSSEGNMERYKQAYQQYKDAREEQKEAIANMTAVFEMQDKIAKGNMLQKQQAAKNALELIGVREEMANNGLNTYQLIKNLDVKQKEADQKAAAADARIAQGWASLDVKRTSAGFKYLKESTNAKGAAQAASNFENELLDAKRMWEKIKKDPEIESAMKAGSAIAPGVIDHLLTANYPEYAKLQQKLGSMAGSMLVNINSGLSAGAQRIKAVEEKELAGLISLKGKNPAAIDQGFDDFIRRVRETRDIQQSRASAFAGTASDIGFDGGFSEESKATPSAGSSQDQEAVAWAKANPKDPRSAAILKANGM